MSTALSTITTPSGKLSIAGYQAVYTSPPTREERQADLRFLNSLGQALHFIRGDAMNDGIKAEGEDMGAILNVTEYSPAYQTNICYVARNVPVENRGYPVSWSHYFAVAPVKDHEQQANLLQLAVDNEWSVAELTEYAAHIRQADKIVSWYPKAPTNDRDTIYLLLNFIKGQTKHKKGDVIDVTQEYLTKGD